MKINTDFFKKLPARETRITIPTWFTLLRIALTPVLVVLMIKSLWPAAFWCFVIASLSDMFDGTLARMRNEQTFLGACLDPLADKFLILSCFFTLAFVSTPLFVLPAWFVWIVLAKELMLVAGVIFFYAKFGYLQIQPTMLSKITTTVQLCFIGWLFTCYFFHWLPIKTYAVMVGAVLVLAIASLVQYAYIGWQLITKSSGKK